MNKTNVKTKPSTTHRHDTPNNKTHIIKFRVTETEKMELQCTSKLARVADVKSRWSTRFSRIENLWPRDGSCPLPLRSKLIFNKCFRIVKAQK